MTENSGQIIDVTVEYVRRVTDRELVGAVKLVQLHNATNDPLLNLSLALWVRPGGDRLELQGLSIAAGGTRNFSDITLLDHHGEHQKQGEPRSVELCLEVDLSGQSGQRAIVLERTFPLEILPASYWSGLAGPPEALAAFVIPEDRAVDEVLAQARRALDESTGNPSLSIGRRRDPIRARHIVAAVYQALQWLGVNVSELEEGFETRGAAIKLPAQVVSERSGTGLDISLLFAGCLERIGLDPVVVLTKRGARVGAWLSGDRFPLPVVDDALRLRKRIEVGDICVVEPLSLDIGLKAPFDQAVVRGGEGLEDNVSFLCAVDVDGARDCRVKPLRMSSAEAGGHASITPSDMSSSSSPLVPDGSLTGRADRSERPSGGKAAVEPEAARLDRWKASLLDLSLRNRLISYRETKKSVPVVCSDIAGLEDAFSGGKLFELWPEASATTSTAIATSGGFVDGGRETTETIDADFLAKELISGRLHTSVNEGELRKRLVNIYRAARRDLEEGGSNTLFLALGFLAWYEIPTSDKRRLAPLLLYPMELVRGSAREPFRLKRTDDEIRLNVSLLHKLAREFEIDTSGLEDLPEDESGLDIPKIFHRFRRAIVDVDRFEVVEEAVLGLFSFTKFVMWRDLEDRSTSLMENDVVRHVVGGGSTPWPQEMSSIALDRLDEEVHPSKSYAVMDADSSQLAAMWLAADDGRYSFVLEGPPGTGKSQTIANVIAQCLARNQTVLFVSEKMAALNVVRTRLDRVGLGDFCLELHSNKARKADVVTQLGRTLDGVHDVQPSNWSSTAGQIKSFRDELNAVAAALHGERSIGETLFQVTSKLIGLRESPLRELDIGLPDDMSEQRAASLREVWRRLSTAAKPVSPLSAHSFRAVRRSEFNPSLPKEVTRACEELAEETRRLSTASGEVCRALGLSENPQSSLADLRSLADLAGWLLESPGPPESLLAESDWEGAQRAIEEVVTHGKKREELHGELSERFDPGRLARLDLESLRARFVRWSTSFFILAWIMLFTARRALKEALAAGRRRLPPNRQIPDDLDRATKLGVEEGIVMSLGARAERWLADLWQGLRSDWTKIEEIMSWSLRLRQLLATFEPSHSGETSKRVTRLATQPTVELAPGTSAASAIENYRSAWTACEASRGRIAALLQLDERRAWGNPESPGHADRVLARLEEWIASIAGLRDICAYRRAEEAVAKEGLGPVAKAFRRGEIDVEELERAFERSFSEWWWTTTIASDERLTTFHGADHQHTIERFRTVDSEILTLSQQLVRGRLCAGVKAVAADESLAAELQVLRREAKKKRRHLPLRSLFQKIPDLLPRLAPCLLMSPLSVAQYLDPSHPQCDLVVFDEASQIPVWDGIGAVARGRHCVVVGDSQQLPPTTFFQYSGGGDDDLPSFDDEFVELESILDECVAAGLPQHRLLWHYRSRHEELITFSNYHYYDNTLLTFPCAEARRKDLGVSLVAVPEGFYDRSKTRTNRAEAEAVVAEIVRRLTDSKEARRSIGVVTFSQAQQTLIEDLLDEARRRHPDIESAFNDESGEPLFVKNLENVQGDERDVMLFSICYGPDGDGHVSMNFGPLNRRGGQRRLNVAITRAREQLVVFSTLRSDQIDLRRTSSEAVRHLRLFLDFAARGARAIDEALTLEPSQRTFDSPFEKVVAEAIRDLGYEVHERVGCSGYRVDLAVVDPEHRERYLLGVECDGAAYASAATARDRDRLRTAVLERLGWSLHRMWSIDFWLDPDGQLASLRRAIDGAKTSSPRE